MKFNLEDSLIEITTGKRFNVLGTPVNCKINSTKTPVYILANRAGDVLVLTEEEINNNNVFIHSKNFDLIINNKM